MAEKVYEKLNFKQKVSAIWHGQSIQSKMKLFALLVLVIILVSVILDVWTMKISLFDFRYSLSANEKVGNVVSAYEDESVALKDYFKGNVSIDELIALSETTDKAVSSLPSDYLRMGEERVAWTQKIVKAHDIYRKATDKYVLTGEAQADFTKKEYELYEMADYLKSYSSRLMTLTTESVNAFYQQRYMKLMIFPFIILGIATILVIAVTHTSRVINESLVDPIVKLADASRRIEKNDIFIEDVEVKNDDEIGDLVSAFNKMKYATGVYITTLEENRIALDKLHAEEMEKKEAENQLERMKFEVLRHQINPHFLFNTLNVISGMARLEDAGVTERMIKALSSIFRYNLRTTEREAPLGQEIEVVKDYMYLQEMRFGDRIRFKVNVDDALENVYIPTFAIQPIVENSVVHGLADKEKGGTITVSVSEGNINGKSMLIIEVADDGKGMTGEELASVKEKLMSDNELRTAIGIGNIYRRLKYMYPDAVFDITSETDRGTKTTISIPLNKGEETENV